LQGERIPSAILKIVFRRIFCFINAVWALASGGFRIVFDTLIGFGDFGLCNFERTLLFQAAFEFQPFNSLECKGNYSATSNNMKLVHWPLMRGLLHKFVQPGRDWAGSPPRCTKCNNPTTKASVPSIILFHKMKQAFVTHSLYNVVSVH